MNIAKKKLTKNAVLINIECVKEKIKMKKYLKTLLVAILVVPCVLLFTACSSDELKDLQEKYDKLQQQYDDATKPQILYGDVDDDGAVTAKDSTILARFLAGWENTTINPAAADVNLDGEVDDLDLQLLRYYLAGWDVSLPEPKYLPGDVNLDGKVDYSDVLLIMYHVDGEITLDGVAFANADVDGDSAVTHLDANLTLFCVRGNVSMDKFRPEVLRGFGDANEDGVLDADDITFIQQYLTGYFEEDGVSEQALSNMDTNFDDEVDLADVLRLRHFFASLDYDMPDFSYTPAPVGLGLIVSSDEPTYDDVVMLTKLLAGAELSSGEKTTLYLQHIRNADINGDGKIDAVDLWLLMQMVSDAA